MDDIHRQPLMDQYDRATRIILLINPVEDPIAMEAQRQLLQVELIWFFMDNRAFAAAGGAGGGGGFSGGSCAICLSDFADGENVGTLGCGHEFHAACLHQWLMIKNECPICRQRAIEELLD